MHSFSIVSCLGGSGRTGPRQHLEDLEDNIKTHHGVCTNERISTDHFMLRRIYFRCPRGCNFVYLIFGQSLRLNPVPRHACLMLRTLRATKEVPYVFSSCRCFSFTRGRGHGYCCKEKKGDAQPNIGNASTIPIKIKIKIELSALSAPYGILHLHGR